MSNPDDDLPDDDLPDDLEDYEDGEDAQDDADESDAEPEPEPKNFNPYTDTTVRRGENRMEVEASLAEWEEGVAADAAANGGVVPPKTSGRSMYPTVRLKNVGRRSAPASDTETELNGLIAECRFLLHEVAFNSARLTYDPDDRCRFLSVAQGLARTAAKVGDTVARLRTARNGAAPVETHRHEIVYTRGQSPSPPSPPMPDSEKQ